MGQVLHGCARTTEAVRSAIQGSEESVRALATRYGVSPTTIQKWRKRTDGAETGSIFNADAGRGCGCGVPTTHTAAA